MPPSSRTDNEGSIPRSFRALEGQAMFDVKPVDESGNIDVEKIDSVKSTINLTSFRVKKQKPIREIQPRRQNIVAPILKSPVRAEDTLKQEKFTPAVKSQEEILPPFIGLPSQQDIKDQFKELMSHDLDLGIELAKFGVTNQLKNEKAKSSKPRYKIPQRYLVGVSSSEVIDLSNKQADEQYAPLISDIHHSATVISREDYVLPVEPIDEFAVEAESLPSGMFSELTQSAETDVRSLFSVPTAHTINKKNSFINFLPTWRWPKLKIPRKYVLVIISVVIAVALIVLYGIKVKNQVIEQSSAAVTNLQTAQEDLEALDFKNASQDFFSAYANFSQADKTLNFLGAGITDILSGLPGGDTLKSAKNLVQVGQLLSAAGTSMTTALDAISKAGAFDSSNFEIDSSGRFSDQSVGIGQIASALKKALVSSQQQVAKASALMVDIDDDIIPADKKDNFNDLKLKLPEFQAGVNMSVEYAKFFENLINNGKAKYLVMFQNSSELRPTGGFPGTYGVVTFNDGKMESIFVDDVYNVDGQLKENIIPPLQMQHITPTWGMRDANWYIDFPTSARNIEAFYKKETGQTIDGVITVNPEMIAKILEIVGPVEMPKYKLTLDSKNVLTTIQDQVEYGPNRTQPKQIVKDFAPLLLTKIYGAGSDKWLTIFNTLVLSINSKDVIMNFNNLSLQSFVSDKGFGGEVKQGDKDYLMATITNIKGSKTDAVTDTFLDVATVFDNNSAVHTVTISRQHNGGKSKFGFYNKQNPAYVRVLVPEGSEIISITGNDKPNFKPLIDYSKSNFIRDDKLVKFETSGSTNSETGVVTYREAGKTEFGFWLITDAGKSKTVTVQYRVPKALENKTYEFYIQKQPALKIKNFNFTLQKPEGLTPEASSPLLTQKDSTYSYTAPLENDLMIKVNFK